MSKQEDQQEAGNDAVVDGELALLRANNKKLTDQVVAERKAKQALEDAIEDAKAAKGDELTQAQRSLKKAQDELDRVNGLYEAQGKQLRTTIIQNEINAAFDEANVLPQMKKPLMALYMSEVEWDAETGEGTYNGAPIKQGVSKVLKSKESAVYIAAPETGGAGAEGNTKSSGAGTAASLFPDLSNVNLGEWGKYQDANKEEANAYATSKNRPDLVV